MLSWCLSLIMPLLFPVKPVLALDFDTALAVKYVVSETGTTRVLQDYTITNLTALAYPQKYSVTVNTAPITDVSAYSGTGSEIPYHLNTGQSSAVIELAFREKQAGKGRQTRFTLEFDAPQIVQKKGSTLDIHLPTLDTQTTTLTEISLKVPSAFGLPVKVSPPPILVEHDPAYLTLAFQPSEPSQPISALFGDKQTYAVTLFYPLTNTTITPVDIQVAFPPDTPHQKIYLDSIEPPPLSIKPDADGNWIATYHLEGQASQTVKYQSYINVYASPQSFVPNSAPAAGYLKELPFWPVTNPQIQTLAQELATPKNIYDYLVSHLNYAYHRTGEPAPKRLGAAAALADPNQSLCWEFADTFVALTRAIGIPARLHTGYGYPVNSGNAPALTPASNYHAWAEFYDSKTQTWNQVDPTWGHTSGSNYFTQIGFNHLTFTLHGHDSELPSPPGNYRETATGQANSVVLAQNFPQVRKLWHSSLNLPLTSRLGLSRHALITLTSLSNTAAYQLPVKLHSTRSFTSPASDFTVSILPYQMIDYNLNFTSSWPADADQVTVTIDDQTQTHHLNYITRPFAAIAGITLSLAVSGFALYLVTKSRHLLVRRRRR